MWASNASRLALLTCPTRTRGACACTLSPSASFHSSESWRRSRIVRVTATADLDSGAGAVEVEEPVKIDRKAADWKKAEKVMESGSIHRGRVDACNSGGLLVRFGCLQGFLPFSQMDSNRVPKGSGRSGEAVMRVSGALALAVAASLASAGASLADEVAVSAADGDAGISTTVSVLFVAATVGLVVLTGGVVYLGLAEFLERRALQEEQKKVESAKPKKEKSGKQAVKAAARTSGPKGFGSGSRAAAKGNDDSDEVSN